MAGINLPTHWLFEKPVDPEKFLAKVAEILQGPA
jgi:hypothetical protein